MNYKFLKTIGLQQIILLIKNEVNISKHYSRQLYSITMSKKLRFTEYIQLSMYQALEKKRVNTHSEMFTLIYLIHIIVSWDRSFYCSVLQNRRSKVQRD